MAVGPEHTVVGELYGYKSRRPRTIVSADNCLLNQKYGPSYAFVIGNSLAVTNGECVREQYYCSFHALFF